MSLLAPLDPEQRAWRWRILISTYFAYAGFYLVRKVFNICKSTLQKSVEDGGYGMSYTDVADIGAAYLIFYMLGQFCCSFIGRKYGPRVIILGGLALSMACNVVFGFANSYTTFLVFMAFNGLVQAAGWPGVVGGVAEWLRKHDRGTIMGIWSTNYVVGNIIVKWLGGMLLLHYSKTGLDANGAQLYDWHLGVRYAFLGCTLLAFAIWWLVYFWQRNRPEDVGLDPIVQPEDREDETVMASNEERVTFREYLALLFNPIVPIMGACYFSIKFLRYALDSWLPTFLSLQGMDVASASFYSSIFDWTGLVGAIVAGYALDRWFKGRWDILCWLLGFGLIAGYYAVMQFGANPYLLAVSFGLVGFMLYGPDTLLCGAAAVIVAGERNAVAVAGLVNGIGSIGPVVQELLIGRLLDSDTTAGALRSTNILGLSMSVVYLVLMSIIVLQVMLRNRRNKTTQT
ncbi:MAG: MFS transporter [Candidatus Hydrogenedentes bacterium]|nr:MFS transporter [Candidatus Hydrogenedentota bacterium]